MVIFHSYVSLPEGNTYNTLPIFRRLASGDSETALLFGTAKASSWLSATVQTVPRRR